MARGETRTRWQEDKTRTNGYEGRRREGQQDPCRHVAIDGEKARHSMRDSEPEMEVKLAWLLRTLVYGYRAYFG